MLVFLHKLKSYGISDQIFGLISFFLSNSQLRVALDGKCSQEHLVNVGIPQSSILGPTLFQLYINDLPDDVVCNIVIYTDDTTLYSLFWWYYSLLNYSLSVIIHLICGNNLNWLLNLSLIYETMDWGKKWFIDFNAGKTQLFSWGKIIF